MGLAVNHACYNSAPASCNPRAPNIHRNQLLLVCSSLLITPLIERGSFSVVDALLYVIGNLTEATPGEYERAALFDGDFWRETGK